MPRPGTWAFPGDLRHRVSAVVAVFIKRIGGEKTFCSAYASTHKGHNKGQDSERYDAAWLIRFSTRFAR